MVPIFAICSCVAILADCHVIHQFKVAPVLTPPFAVIYPPQHPLPRSPPSLHLNEKPPQSQSPMGGAHWGGRSSVCLHPALFPVGNVATLHVAIDEEALVASIGDDNDDPASNVGDGIIEGYSQDGSKELVLLAGWQVKASAKAMKMLPAYFQYDASKVSVYYLVFYSQHDI